MTLISGYATIVGEGQFQLVMFHDQKLFHLFDPILQPQNITLATMDHGTIGPITGVLTLFLFLINLIAMGLVFGLAFWQISLISKGQTCVEEKIDASVMTGTVQKQQRRPYDVGWKRNWRNFFEVDSVSELVLRLFVCTPFRPKHDGTHWESKFDD
jgi:hypothetical protein